MENQVKETIEKSDSIKELATALSKFQGKVENIGKDAENPYFKSKYASLEAIVDAIRAPLAENGLAYSQFPIGKNKLVTVLMHNSGEFISSTVEMTPKDTSPQAHGSVLTYMRRYSISAIFGLATEEDDDGNSASVSKPTTVKSGKAGSEELYAKTVQTIEKYTTTAQLEAIRAKLETSKKFTDGQKDKLEKLIDQQVTFIISEQK